MKIAVGSENPVKIEAVKIAFQKIFPDKKLAIYGVKVRSEVSHQPMSDEESIRGALNRAKKAIKLLGADFGVGLEGGLQKIGQYWFDCGWIVVVDWNNKIGIGSTIRINTPTKMMRYIKKGMELGSVCDIIFKKENSKQKEGQFGLMTNNVITRTSGYCDGVISALASFINPELF